MDEVGIGLFGYGFIASAHVAALRTAGARIVAVCGPHRERAETFARRYAIAHVYTEPARMLARADIAAVVVASPDASHAALTMAAAIRQGEAGTLISLHAQRSNATLLGPEATHTWRTDARQSGLGVLGDLGSHMIDLALLLAGPIAEVSADLLTFVQELPDAVTGRPVPQRLDDDVTLALRFAGGAHGTISLSRVGLADAHLPLGRSQIVVNGSKLAIISDGIAHATVHRLGSAPQEWPLDARVAGLDHGALLAYLGEELMRAFLEAIRSGMPVPPTLEDGLAVQAVLDAALRSANSRCWEHVPEANLSV